MNMFVYKARVFSIRRRCQNLQNNSKHKGGIWPRLGLVVCISWGLASAEKLPKLHNEAILWGRAKTVSWLCGPSFCINPVVLYFQKNTPFFNGSVLYLNYRTNTEQSQYPKDITQELLSCFRQLVDRQYDDKAITCIVKSLEDQLEGIMEDFSNFISHMSSLDDTWAFWSSSSHSHPSTLSAITEELIFVSPT